MTRRFPILCCAAAIAVGVLAPPAAARAIDLAELREPRLVATQRGAWMNDVSPAGDVNGDGEQDVIVAGSGRDFVGVVRVFFGPLPKKDASLDRSPSKGFSIHGAEPGDYADVAAAAGDVNGDSLDDLIVVAAGIESRAYVVFGKTTQEDVELSEFDDGTQGAEGFRIDGDFRPFAGTVGDTDGDHLSDVFVAGYGRVFVVRGKADTLPVDVATFGLGVTRGYEVQHPRRRRDGWSSAAFAGDANGDGLGDLAISAGTTTAQALWVVFGKPDDTKVRVRELGDAGYTIDGAVSLGGLGTGGDVNGDDLDDLVVGDSYANRAYVVFGQADTSPVPLDDLGTRGFRILGPPTRTRQLAHAAAGRFVAGDVDVDADGLSDFVVSAPEADHRRRRDSGSAYLLFGRRGTNTIRLGRLGDKGIRLDGEDAGDRLGTGLALAGDVTGDGLPDLLLGEYGERGAGAVHVVSYRLLF